MPKKKKKQRSPDEEISDPKETLDEDIVEITCKPTVKSELKEKFADALSSFKDNYPVMVSSIEGFGVAAFFLGIGFFPLVVLAPVGGFVGYYLGRGRKASRERKEEALRQKITQEVKEAMEKQGLKETELTDDQKETLDKLLKDKDMQERMKKFAEEYEARKSQEGKKNPDGPDPDIKDELSRAADGIAEGLGDDGDMGRQIRGGRGSRPSPVRAR